MTHWFLLLEFVVLFVALPVAYRYSPWRISPLPILWLAAAYCWWTLGRAHLPVPVFGAAAVPATLPSAAVIFLIIASIIVYCIWRFIPDALFDMPRQRPALWMLVMVLYPVFSVYPQGIVYRVFLMERYAVLFPHPLLLVVVSAFSFGFMHLVFRNWVAVGLTAFGGLLFAWRFQHTGSMAASSYEHALYGCLLFTAGLGRYIYHGTVALAEAVEEVVEEVSTAD
ncbi:CPBP family glutamic-type intramembrane protease [Terriglobus tenax]|uniref:CPBP family glutamic-type intramembrane protease n=1 Tax=Terriglobus tenax TaxID=1111115 RepID=UPI0021DFF8BF|nr:CPBP family glutamic-type intramembrane protease [Terriglobus tenax]